MRASPLRVLATIAALAAGTLVAACGVSRGVTGNDTGGIIQVTPGSEAHAEEIAAVYCARYHKYAHITSDHPRYGDYIGFACRWKPSHRVGTYSY
jgi:hypothetical protein